ncbi:MAG: peptidoglycan DD-metalloendopeptidase family protein [Acidaminococcaceae bacterium]
MHTKKPLAVFLITVLLFLLLAPAVLAATDEENQARLETIQQQLYNKEVERDNAKQVVESATDKLVEAQNQLGQAQNELEVVVAEESNLQTQIDENNEIIGVQQAKFNHQLKAYRTRLRDIYINGQINYLDVLLGAKDFSDFSSRMYLLQKIIAGDVKLMDKIAAQKQALEAEQELLRVNVASIQKVKNEVDGRRQQVAAKTAQRAAVYNDAVAEQDRLDEEYNELMAISDNITRMLQNRGGNTSAVGTGRFIWPIRGEITSYFGWRTHPIFGTTKYHSGMDIAADYDDLIVAADSGTVIFADWMGGYGNAVMIDHGGGLVTLYGHNNSLAVSEGQQVGQGQVIAYAGSTGYSTGPHCHFEVRLNGEVTEPLNYLP